MNVDIRLMDQLDASIAECDTIFAGARHADLVCLDPHLLSCLQMPGSALCSCSGASSTCTASAPPLSQRHAHTCQQCIKPGMELFC